ncbi:MAG: ABC transporter ATP-binding protein [Halanaerobium sp.]|nr:ABC transporter ATP-binding protein [Halanaerobium sp.]
MFQVKDLFFRYPSNDEDTLKGITFTIEDGEIFGLLGPSGVGKSTTQKILVKLLDRYRGEILYNGKDLRAYDRDFYQQVGVGFEMPVHFSKLTARENLEFFGKLYDQRIDIEQTMERLGLLTDLDKPVAEYSRGMKVRLNFARAILNKPRMLFLDEPTAGLDPKNARIIKDIIREFRGDGGTVLLTTHLMNDVDELCDRIAFMVDGRITETDSPKNLKMVYGERKVKIEYLSVDGEQLEAEFDLDSLGEEEEFMEIIQNRKLLTIHSGETTLDDIFIKVTGVGKYE